jgi:hypothetical protein
VRCQTIKPDLVRIEWSKSRNRKGVTNDFFVAPEKKDESERRYHKNNFHMTRGGMFISVVRARTQSDIKR